MDINARINWMPGMEFTVQTFKGIAEHWDFKQRLALQAALGSNRMGLIPDAPFNCKAVFVRNMIEVEEFQCMALLPSGRIVNAEENVQVAIPMLFGSKYYLTIGFDDHQMTEFEKEGVPFIKPHYEYAIHTQEEVENADLFPLLRLHLEEGVLTIDPDFIPPCLQLTADSRIKDYINQFADRLKVLSSHPSLADGEGKRTLLRYIFMLKDYCLRNNLQDFILLTQEIAQATDYHIVTPNREQPVEIPTPSTIDLQEWLQWLDDYLAGAAVILDGVVLKDNTIDYEALLAQAKAELYERLNPEMLESIKNSLHEEMQQLRIDLTTYVNEELKDKLLAELTASANEQMERISETLAERVEQMGKDLNASLYEKLYFELFENLFNALYVPEPEDHFVPLI